MIKDDKFTTDYGNLLFTVTIKACEGGIMLDLDAPADKEHPSVQAVIGTLEYMKTHLIMSQREGNKSLLEAAKFKNDKPTANEKK